jgi:hypothetical protein
MKRYAYYHDGQDYTLEPNGSIIGYVRAKTRGKAEKLIARTGNPNPIITSHDLQD